MDMTVKKPQWGAFWKLCLVGVTILIPMQFVLLVWRKNTDLYHLLQWYDDPIKVTAKVMTHQGHGLLWPLPQKSTQCPSNTTLIIDTDRFKFTAVAETCEDLDKAFARVLDQTFHPMKGWSILVEGEEGRSVFQERFLDRVRLVKTAVREDRVATLTELRVVLKKPCEKWPSLDMNERYELKIEAAQQVLSASSIWGILHGLETFSQLVQLSTEGQFMINCTRIIDYPSYSHRGILIDTARHYIPMHNILRTLDAMRMNKMNVFHWHIVDDQSFPYQSAKFPQLSDKGAYNPYTHVYTQADIAEIIDYARKRGIRVMPEFDTPGHTQAWAAAKPDFLTKCFSKHVLGFKNGSGPVDPTVESNYKFLGEFFNEVFGVFPEQYIHLGGDEVDKACWKESDVINKFMRQHNMTSYNEVEDYYMQRLLQQLDKLERKKKYVVWQEVFEDGVKLPKSTLVHLWLGNLGTLISKATTRGYRVLVSCNWYLNYIATKSDWKEYYAQDPRSYVSGKARKLIVGGEAALWGEYIDATNLESTLWPRAIAVAERLWTGSAVQLSLKTQIRFEEQRCRMLRRGFSASPQNGPSHCDIVP